MLPRKRFGGYAHHEIAGLLDVPVNTVCSRLQTTSGIGDSLVALLQHALDSLDE